MSNVQSLTDFFAAWTTEDVDGRGAFVASAIGDGFSYMDPRTEQPITDAGAMSDYLAMFLQNCPPGAAVNVLEPVDVRGNTARLTIDFVMGPDMKQTGQYFADLDDAGKITRLVGFVGKGAE